MVLLDLICITFLGVCSSCLCMFLCVRVTAEGKVGYGSVMEEITSRQSVKIETISRQIKLEANHR